MSKLQEFSAGPVPPEGVLANVQHNIVCWSRAWAQVAQSLIAAEMAHLELARSIYTSNSADWGTGLPAADPQSAMLRRLETGKDRFDTVLRGYRNIGDDLSAGFFDAAKCLAAGFETGAGHAETATTTQKHRQDRAG